MNRFLIYCFYDKNGIADDYVFYFLDKILPFCSGICIVINGYITKESEEGFKKYTDKILKRENYGFDSGAFKHAVNTYGFDYFKHFDEVIFANDTFYGPLFDLESMFSKMENDKNIDFWGITKHPKIDAKVADIEINEHLQSYFLAYKRKILLSPDFEEYWMGMKTPTNYDEAILFYEFYTTDFFVSRGYKAGCFIDINPEFAEKEQAYFYNVSDWVEKEHIPFIKKKIFEMDKASMKNPIKGGVLHFLDIINKMTDYDINMICFNVKRLYADSISFRNIILMSIQYAYIMLKRSFLPWKWNHYQRKLKAIRDKSDYIRNIQICENKRILLVSQDLAVTGAPLVLLLLAKYLLKKNYIVDVVTFKDGMSHELYENYEQLGISVEYIYNKSSDIKKYCSKHLKKYSLVICNTVVSYRFVKIAKRYKKQAVWYIHETKLLDDYIKVFPDFEEVLTKHHDIYVVSEYTANRVKKYNSDVKVIPNGIEDKFEKFYINDDVTFGYIGSINKLKGFDILLDVFLELSVKYPNVKLIVAGDCEDVSVIKAMKNCRNINWLGQVNKEAKTDFFKQINILCVPSLDDPCPLTLIEGVMYGKAIITTDKTGNNYFVRNEVNGFIVPANNKTSLYNSMEYFCLNSDKIEQMQQESRKMYLEYGTLEKYENKIYELLQTHCV